MNVLQVKDYHNQIASKKYQDSICMWKDKDNGYSYPVKSMFYFMITDNKGYSIKEREKGYVAFTDNRYCFNLNRNKAIQMIKT